MKSLFNRPIYQPNLKIKKKKKKKNNWKQKEWNKLNSLFLWYWHFLYIGSSVVYKRIKNKKHVQWTNLPTKFKNEKKEASESEKSSVNKVHCFFGTDTFSCNTISWCNIFVIPQFCYILFRFVKNWYFSSCKNIMMTTNCFNIFTREMQCLQHCHSKS